MIEIGDLLCELFDELRTAPLQLLEDVSGSRLDDLTLLAEQGRAGVIRSRADLDLGDDAAKVVALLALDQVLGDVVFGPPAHPFRDLHQRYEETGLLNSPAAAGALLAKRADQTRQGSPEYLWEHLAYVTRVPKETWDRIDFVKVNGDDDLDLVTERNPLVVACCPFIDDLAHFSVTEVVTPGLRYRLGPGTVPDLEGRISRILSELDKSGANVALLPEGILDQATIEVWQKVIARSPLPRASRLAWIVLGSGPTQTPPDRGANEVVVLSRTRNDVIARQHKRGRYNLNDHTIEELCLRGHLPTMGVHNEDIALHDRLTVVETRAGRFCFLICEDLDRLTHDGPMLAAIGPSFALVPIFSQEMEDKGWEEKDSTTAGRQYGVSSVVANSLALMNARIAAGKTIASPPHTCLARCAVDHVKTYPSTYWHDHTHAEEVGTFHLWTSAGP